MTWIDFFNSIEKKAYFIELLKFIDDEYNNYSCFPLKENIFRAFKLTPFEEIKVIIIGQDPYFNKGEANGLAFSVNKDIKLPPSLRNIYKEIELEYNVSLKERDGDLSYLSTQGVFLINSILSVREGNPLSHQNKLYQEFFNDLLDFLSENKSNLSFLLFGKAAQKYEKKITNPLHQIIKTTHPSPLGANQGGWFNSLVFKKANDYLRSSNLKPIKWY